MNVIVSSRLDSQLVHPTGLLLNRILPAKGPLGASWVQIHSTTQVDVVNVVIATWYW